MKDSFRDVIPSTEKRSIRNIPISKNHQSHTFSNELHNEPPHEPPVRPKSPVPAYGKYTAIGLLVVIVLVIVYSISTVFAEGIITVTPKTATATINISVTAEKEPVSDGSLGYDLLSVTKTESQTITATTTAVVSQKASGKIIIYNNYSDASQTLITNTRFETPDGLIYRIQKSVVVPGMTTKAGKAVPGSVEVTVYADQPGAQYNIAPSDFTIPGFQSNSAEYAGFYGRSDGSITGGASGQIPVVTSGERTAVRNQLDQNLKGDLISSAQNQTPGSFVFFPSASNIVYQSLPDSSASSSNPLSVTINEQGVLEAAIFNENDLSADIASNVLTDYASSTPISVTNLSSLQFLPQGSIISNLSASTTDPISFTITGNGSFVWQFDQNQLKKDLSGKSKKDAPVVLSNSYPGIEQADVVIRPFWLDTIPTDVNKIVINIKN